SLPRTSAAAACSSASSPSGLAAEASPSSHRSRAWMPTPGRGANANGHGATLRPSRGSADPVRADPARKKKSGRPDDPDRTAPGGNGRRSGLRPEGDAPFAPQDPPGVAAPGPPTVAAHDGPAVVSASPKPADPPPTAGRHSRSRPRSAV